MKLTVVYKEIVPEDTGLRAFFPMHQGDIDKVQKIKTGEIRQLEIKNPRNLKHHNKFMAMIRMVLDNSEDWKNEEHILFHLKTVLGYGEYLRAGQHMVFVPSSISFENMEQAEFEEKIYKPGVIELANMIGITPDDLEYNYDNFL